MVAMPLWGGRVVGDLWEEIAVELGASPPLFLVGSEFEAMCLRHGLPSARIGVDRRSFRGPAGVLADAVMHDGYLASAEVLLVCDGSRVPDSRAVAAVLAAHGPHDLGHAGVVLSSPHGEFGGIILLHRRLVELVPSDGFVDLKEQFVPLLHAKGLKLAACVHGDALPFLGTPASYLDFCKAFSRGVWIDPGAVVDPTAKVEGASIVSEGARIGPSAVVLDSVIMRGAEVDAGAVVARSIVGPQGLVSRSRLVTDDTVVRLSSREFSA